MYVVFYISLGPRFVLNRLHMQNIYIKNYVVYILYIKLSVYRIGLRICYVTICSFYIYLYTMYSLYSIFSIYTLYYILYIEYIEYRDTFKTMYCIHYKHSIYTVWGVGQSGARSAPTVCPVCRTLTTHTGDLFGPGGGKGSVRKPLLYL